MNLVRIEILISLFGAFLYIVVWIIYRVRCRVAHNKLLRIHQEELIRRAEIRIECGREDMPSQELIRQAHWDAQFGPLMQPMQIKNREESHWPIGNAFQGLSAIIAGIILASIFSDGRTGGDQQPPIDSTVRASGDILNHIVVFEIFTSAMLLLSGATLFVLSKSKYARIVGVCLVVGSSILPAAKLINVEKIVNIEKLISGNINIKFGQKGESSIQQSNEIRFSTLLTFPPFDSGSAIPNASIFCAVSHLTKFDLANSNIISFVIAGRADRTNLRAATQHLYATNWGLAQQRANEVERMLLDAGVHKSRIVTTNAGPIHTARPSRELLALDRAVTILINGVGEPPQWLLDLSASGWPSCERHAAAQPIIPPDLAHKAAQGR